MSGSFLLDWATLAASLFNMILLAWLGLTVLFTAERRTWGVWLAVEGLLMGAAFFVAHSAILARDSLVFGPGINFWWRAGWIPVVASPFAWYCLMLWYCGFFDNPRTPGSTEGINPLYRRQLVWSVFTVLFTLFLLGLLVVANPLPNFWKAAQLDLSGMPSLYGVPLLFAGFPVYILLCIGLALDALLRPAPSGRLMGDQARRRARPWLLVATFVLLAVCVVVGGVLFWLIYNAQLNSLLVTNVAWDTYLQLADSLFWFDLLLVSLIGLAILLMGQALVSYEVFTGKVLPRRGLFRQWRTVVILAAGVSAALSASLSLQLRPIYSVLLALLLMVTFYALAGWRAHLEREESMHRLRPFVSGPRLYERLLTTVEDIPAEADLAEPFEALCRDVLGVEQALLWHLGPLAALAGAPLCYPRTASINLPAIGDPVQLFATPGIICLPLQPARHAGFLWAVPLWSERGLAGVLLLGEKSGGGFFSLEEIEIARASAERIVDLRASLEMARRLMALQRQRLAQSQVLDRRARRVLHDDILPSLHTALLVLSAQSADAPNEATDLLAQAHRQISDLLREMPAATAPEVAQLGLAGALRSVLDNELRDAFDGVTWRVAPEAEERAAALPPLQAEVIFYAAREAMRNAAQHARPTNLSTPLRERNAAQHARPLSSSAALHLRVEVGWQAGLRLVVEDDGVGLSASRESAHAGGQGLALHSTLMAVIGGALALESAPGEYTRVVLSLPE
jgi:signal transduction histidine kinase